MNRTNTFHRFTAGLLSLILVLTMTLSVMPLTAFAYSGTLTISGAIIEQSFNFQKGGSGQDYLFGLQNPPESLQTYEWSVEGTLPAGLSLMDSTKSSAYIGGTPTEVTTEPVALTVCVRAKAVNGDVYYGETDILVSVYEPINPFEEAEALLKATDCTVPMATANTEATVLAWLNDTWLPGIDGLSAALGDEFAISELSVVSDENFTAATAGNAADPDGTDGRVTFTVEIGGEMVLCENLTCTVKATAYNHTHSFSDTYTYDDTYHWHTCTDPECDAVSAKAEHSGGTATYTARAVCSVCGQSYGETAADTTPPTGSITVGTNTWNSFLNTITFGLFFKETQEVQITAADTESGVMKTGYYLSDEKVSDFGSVTWTEYNGNLKISQDNEYVIYVKITDNAGNSAIICSNGIVIDKTAPIISGIENNKTYCGAVEVTVSEEYLDSVKLNGTEIELTNGKFTIGSANGQQSVIATDMAGNKTSLYVIRVKSEHTWSEKLEKIDSISHGHICSVCGEKKDVSQHNFDNTDDVCSDCGYEAEQDYSPADVTVYNNSSQSNATIWLAGSGLSSGDILVTDRDPQGSAYEALTKLANSDDVFATYNIYLRSGNKSTGNPMELTFDLLGKYGEQDFTLVHEKADTTYEYFYDTADANGDLTFGPLYELSPFMLVKGTLLPPQESVPVSPQMGDNRNLWLWIALLFVSGGAVTVLGITGKRHRAANDK